MFTFNPDMAADDFEDGEEAFDTSNLPRDDEDGEESSEVVRHFVCLFNFFLLSATLRSFSFLLPF